MMNNLPLSVFLVLALILFAIGLFGALTKRNAIMVLISIELMVNAVTLNMITFTRYGIHPGFRGEAFALLIMAIAAVEAVVGLAIIFTFSKKRLNEASVQSSHLGQWQTFGTAVLVGISAVFMIVAVTGGYFQ